MRCINNQRSFIDYKEEIDLNIRTVEIIDNPKIKKIREKSKNS